VTDVKREKWLLLDDSANDRRRARMALAQYESEVELVEAATLAEAREYLEKQTFKMALLDFYLKGNTTSERLIAEIRDRFPDMPIIVVSSEAGKSRAIYGAGADAISPKMPDTASFASSLRNAVFHAKAVRASRVHRTGIRKVYIPNAIENQIKLIIQQRRSGNVLVESVSGMGRTDIARDLAARIWKRWSSANGRDVLFIQCASRDETHHSDFDSELFGRRGGEVGWEHGLLKASEDGVLVIDDVHLLPEATQTRLKTLIENGGGTSNTGMHIDANRLRLVFTLNTAESQKLITGFVQGCVSQHIRIPLFASMVSEKKAIVEFCFERGKREYRQRRLHAAKGLIRVLNNGINKSPYRVTLRSVIKTVDSAIANARNDARSLVTEMDLDDLPLLYEVESTANHTPAAGMFSIENDDPIGAAAWRDLYFAIRNGTLEESEQLVKKMMIDYAMLKHDGNKSNVAKQLRISRQHLYKPSLRAHHLDDE
jgi:DNA-binding NtrC family response regulator